MLQLLLVFASRCAQSGIYKTVVPCQVSVSLQMDDIVGKFWWCGLSFYRATLSELYCCGGTDSLVRRTHNGKGVPQTIKVMILKCNEDIKIKQINKQINLSTVDKNLCLLRPMCYTCTWVSVLIHILNIKIWSVYLLMLIALVFGLWLTSSLGSQMDLSLHYCTFNSSSSYLLFLRVQFLACLESRQQAFV